MRKTTRKRGLGGRGHERREENEKIKEEIRLENQKIGRKVRVE